VIFQPRKAALYQLAIEHGIGSSAELNAYLPLGSSVPQPRLEGWLNWLFRPPKAFSNRRRYINRFRLGADPEFIFASAIYDALDGRLLDFSRADAGALGLAQGPAFGADNNGRLAEVRPYPSRSAVEVVASILCTLRWLALQMRSTLQYDWLAGAYLADDGIGGHVHFGRKRPTRKEEVAALDAVEEGLLYLGVYPKDQVLRRRLGDARRQIYGALGDYRLQQHGYEYRTFPSWLDSPEIAFLTLVVSKLAVQMPALYKFKAAGPERERARLRNFLAYFKGVDDDARLALVVLDRGIPQPKTGSFAPRWGIVKEALPKKWTNIQIIPPSIKPDVASVQEVFDYLHDSRPLGFRVPEVTWAPTAPPEGYQMCLPLANTILAKGLGELIWDLCCHSTQPIYFVNGRDGPSPLQFSRHFLKVLPKNWKERFAGIPTTVDVKPGTIIIGPELREGARAGMLKKILLNGVLPIWQAKDCKPDSFKLWQERCKGNPPVAAKLVGKVVYLSQALPEGALAI
jgi:hypothetical protein